jgi:2-oxoglutarate dehydrogenase E1 component
MLLPHGYEGMGPEHSSARLERFLQLCAEKNMIVGNLTTPAQYFHALRRQKHRDFRKPLVLMTPKSLLGRPEAVSDIEGFPRRLVFPGSAAGSDEIRRHRQGQPRDLLHRQGVLRPHGLPSRKGHRKHRHHPHRAALSVPPRDGRGPRQPIPADASHFVWCQEEPLNMGAWSYIWPRLDRAVGAKVRYAGRDAASSPAAGSKAMHYREQKALLEHAFTI